MNDPNGLVSYQGEYHLFYQYHPESTVWGPMHWGHAVSRDLINWKYLPIALYPDEHGMIFSGSAVVDWNNTAGFGKEALVAIFTYNKDYKETQNLAYSLDKGRTWTKYSGNPVIPAPNPLSDCRDPKVFWHEDHWVMLLTAGDKILFYTSSDLRNWEQSGSFGKRGSTTGVWETPDLFKLSVSNENQTRWVLTAGVGNGHPAGGSGTQYFIGEFDGRQFTSEGPQDTVLWADYGADYYAPQSWNDEPHHRRLMLGWMNNWQYAKVIPAAEWRGSFSLIRELSLKRTEAGIRLVHQPIPELQTLRQKSYHLQNEMLTPEVNLLTGLQGEVFEITAEFQLTNDVKLLGFHVRVGKGERTTIGYDVQAKKVFVDRTHSGQNDFHEGFADIHSTELICADNILRLHIFVDHGSVEAFADDGLLVITDCVFPAAESTGLELFVEGDPVRLNQLDIFQLASASYTT